MVLRTGLALENLLLLGSIFSDGILYHSADNPVDVPFSTSTCSCAMELERSDEAGEEGEAAGPFGSDEAGEEGEAAGPSGPCNP